MQIGSLTLRVIAWRSGRWSWTPRLVHQFGQTRISGVWHLASARVLVIYPNAAPLEPESDGVSIAEVTERSGGSSDGRTERGRTFQPVNTGPIPVYSVLPLGTIAPLQPPPADDTKPKIE